MDLRVPVENTDGTPSDPIIQCTQCGRPVVYCGGPTGAPAIWTRAVPGMPMPRLDWRQRQERDAELNHCRPCGWISCRHNLYLEVNPDTGSIKINADVEPWEMPETCSLDVAQRGGITLEDIGAILGLTRERIRQVEVRGLMRMRIKRVGREDDEEY